MTVLFFVGPNAVEAVLLAYLNQACRLTVVASWREQNIPVAHATPATNELLRCRREPRDRRDCLTTVVAPATALGAVHILYNAKIVFLGQSSHPM